jgi:oligoribonuclease (3'-5' exoribonuclease)
MAHDNPNSHGLRALKIVKDSNINYWVEFRQQFTSNSRTMNGVLINWGYNKNTQSNLIDTTPGSATGNSDASDAALAIGQTFVDEQAGIQIKPLRKVGTSPESIDVD